MGKAFQILFCLTLLINCRDKEKNTIYTIQGKILDGTTGKWWIGLPISFYAVDADGKNVGTIADTKTDSFGNFKIEYKHSVLNGREIWIYTDIKDYTGLPFNQDVNRIIYFSSQATLKVKFKTPNPLNDDTLFYCHVYEDKLHTDTLTRITGDFEQIKKIPNYTYRAYWGRGYKEFILNKNMDDIIFYQHEESLDPKGDPYVDSITINY